MNDILRETDYLNLPVFDTTVPEVPALGMDDYEAWVEYNRQHAATQRGREEALAHMPVPVPFHLD